MARMKLLRRDKWDDAVPVSSEETLFTSPTVDLQRLPPDQDSARERDGHLDDYLKGLDGPVPHYVFPPGPVDVKEHPGGVVYPIAPLLYVHLAPDPHMGLKYVAIEPVLGDEAEEVLDLVRLMVFRRALYHEPPKNNADLARIIEHIMHKFVHTGPVTMVPKIRPGSRREDMSGMRAFRAIIDEMRPHMVMPKQLREAVRYHLLRDLAAGGPLQPVLMDPFIEDIHSTGTESCFVIHKHHGMVKTNLGFRDEVHLDTYVENLAERIGRPVSESNPIVDATLADGSRINIVYSDTVSRRGASFSIRRVTSDPLSITRLIQWGTIDARMAAYLWLCLENGMSLFLCGDAACGKTTTLNALLVFVDPRSKLYTAEDTPEVVPPHRVWQRLITRETGAEQGQVKMFDLLKAALRSRPNYIVVGEIRGAEGAVAFQAMQTGHPVIASFHAASVEKMVQRITSDPINVPHTFIDNLNVALIQKSVRRGDRVLRRVVDITEIEGYSEVEQGVMTRPLFTYDAKEDKHAFRGRNNSYVLEDKIAETLGYADPRMIYDDLEERAAVLRAMVREGVFDHHEVGRLVDDYLKKGVSGLPFTI